MRVSKWGNRIDVSGHIIFGEWWNLGWAADDKNRLPPETAQMLHSLRMAADVAQPARQFPPRQCPAEFPIDGLSGGTVLSRVAASYEGLVEEFSETRDVVGEDLFRFGRKFAEKWGRQNQDPIGMCRNVLREFQGVYGGPADVIIDSVVPRLASASVAHQVDLALFPPLPPEAAPEVWLAPSFERSLKDDPLAVMKICLAISHEVMGHLLQHRLNVVGATAGKVLDRELMEGWGVAAESILRRFGQVESAAVSLYRFKRLFPLGHEALGGDDWEVLKRRLTSVWPEFFSEPSFAIFRRATRRHAMGLLRMEIMDSSSIGMQHGEEYPRFTPWREH